jgi:hypothetical protein
MPILPDTIKQTRRSKQNKNILIDIFLHPFTSLSVCSWSIMLDIYIKKDKIAVNVNTSYDANVFIVGPAYV